MNMNEQRLFSSTVFQLSTYIWDIVVRARQGYANDVDFERGFLLAANLNLLLSWYQEQGLSFLPATTIWMCHEIVTTLSDMKESYSNG